MEAHLTKEGVAVGSIVMKVRHNSNGYMILAMLQSIKKIIRLNTLIVTTDEGRMTTVEVILNRKTKYSNITYYVNKYNDTCYTNLRYYIMVHTPYSN